MFGLILYTPANNFSAMSGKVFLGWTSTKLGLMCLAHGHNTTMVRLELATPRSQVKHPTTEPLCSQIGKCGIVNGEKEKESIYISVRMG